MKALGFNGLIVKCFQAIGFKCHTYPYNEVLPYLNQSLKEAGYPSPLDLLLPNATDLARTCNALFMLLRDRQKDAAVKESWNDERRRLHSDLNRLDTQVARLREAYEVRRCRLTSP